MAVNIKSEREISLMREAGKNTFRGTFTIKRDY